MSVSAGPGHVQASWISPGWIEQWWLSPRQVLRDEWSRNAHATAAIRHKHGLTIFWSRGSSKERRSCYALIAWNMPFRAVRERKTWKIRWVCSNLSQQRALNGDLDRILHKTRSTFVVINKIWSLSSRFGRASFSVDSIFFSADRTICFLAKYHLL
jgi:hypothetical protein